MKNNAKYIIDSLNRIYPDAHCELNHTSNFELLVAVILSAQTTDERVNLVTPKLFKKYPSPKALACAKLEDIEEIIKSIGLYHNKAKNIQMMAKELVDSFNGEVPANRKDLESLPGVGRKTANVVLNCCFNEAAFAVDTHVSRVSKRLKIAKRNDEPLIIEKKLMKYFPKETWGKLHHQFIFFGRYKCKAMKPDCSGCPFLTICDRAS